MRRELSSYLASRALVGSLAGHKTQLGPITPDIEAYHEARKAERAGLMQALSSDIPLHRRIFCSVGAGAAGEESLLTPGKLVLIEPDPQFAEFLREKHPAAEVIESAYEKLTVPADVIYASGLGPWMNADPTCGIDADFTAFCKRSLRPDGVVVALIYGGLHTPFVLDRRHYLQQLIASTDLNVALYGKYRPANALLVLTQKPIALPSLADQLTQTLIENGEIRAAGKPMRSVALATAAAVAIYSARNALKVVTDAVRLLRVNRRLLR